MGESKNTDLYLASCSLPSPDKETDFDFTIEIAETESIEKRLDDFASIVGKAVFRYTSAVDSVLGETENSIFYKKYALWKRLQILQSNYQTTSGELIEIEKEGSELSKEEENLLLEFGSLYEECDSHEKGELLEKYGHLTKMWINRQG